MPVTDGKVLELVELTKVFKGFWGRERVKAVDRLNLEVVRGEVFGLLGPNGSGKTTTVRMVLGLLFPSQGAIRIFGRGPRNVEVKQRVGYMPEESHLYPYLNAEETLNFFGRLFGLGPRERARRTDALIDMVGLGRARRRPLGEYSKGMARRIGLAQALINDPDLVILDEPTTGLDPVGSREMKDLILTLRDRGKTVFLCSHLLADVEEICDRVCILYGGKRRALGTVGELLKAEEMTQIRTQRLDGAIVEQVVAAIRQAVGPDGQVEVSAPTKRLEEFFLQVVHQARQERLMTAGAEVGAGAAQFLGEHEDEDEKLVEELVTAGRQAEEEGAAEEETEPASALPSSGDQELIEDLVRMSDTDDEVEEEFPEEAQPAVGPSVRVREDVLSELISEESSETEDDGKED